MSCAPSHIPAAPVVQSGTAFGTCVEAIASCLQGASYTTKNSTGNSTESLAIFPIALKESVDSCLTKNGHHGQTFAIELPTSQNQQEGTQNSHNSAGRRSPSGLLLTFFMVLVFSATLATPASAFPLTPSLFGRDCQLSDGVVPIYRGANTACGIALGVLNGTFDADDDTFNPLTYSSGSCNPIDTVTSIYPGNNSRSSGGVMSNTFGFNVSAGNTYDAASVDSKFKQSINTSDTPTAPYYIGWTVPRDCGRAGACNRSKYLFAHINGTFCIGTGCEKPTADLTSGSMTIPQVDVNGVQAFSFYFTNPGTDDLC